MRGKVIVDEEADDETDVETKTDMAEFRQQIEQTRLHRRDE